MPNGQLFSPFHKLEQLWCTCKCHLQDFPINSAHTSGITLGSDLSELQTGHSNQCVKLRYLCIAMIALITTWIGADSAAALNDAV